MTLNELFELAADDEDAAIAAIGADPDLAKACEPAGDHQRGEAAPALVHAAHRGLARVVGALLDAGADLQARGMDGGTALHVAAWSGHAATVRVLLDRGAPIETRCIAYDGTPLLWAAHGFSPEGCFPKREQVEAARMLLAAGADRTSPNRWDNTPLDLVREPADNPMRALLESALSTV